VNHLYQLDDVEQTNGYFQQDSAAAHTSRATIKYLNVLCCVVSQRTPDLTLLDFFLFPPFKEPILIGCNGTSITLSELCADQVLQL
jgi:hypothetical protein